MPNSGFESHLAELKNRYLRSLPDRIAAIAEALRLRQKSGETSGSLDRQFHNLAGTAGTFGLFAIAAAATDGFDECAELDGARIDGDARYLWSIVEELENEVSTPWRNRYVELGAGRAA